jgi:hypothetical protein
MTRLKLAAAGYESAKSLFSTRSILSFGSARSILSVRSHGKSLHVDDIPLRDWRRDRGKSPAPADKIDDRQAAATLP